MEQEKELKPIATRRIIMSAAEFKYASPISGNLAYDYEKIPRYSESTLDMPADPVEKSNTEEKTVSRAALISRQGVSPLAVLGSIVAAVLLVMALLAQIQITQISDSSVTLEKQYLELVAEQARLKIEYERAFNFTEIEKQAIAELGMQKPREGQVFFINGSAPDKAVVLNREKSSDSILDKLSDILAKATSFFG